MKIHEYQAKQTLAKFGVATPRGEVAFSAEEAHAVAERLGGAVVVKAQIHAGGRGKAGGVKLAHTPSEAEQIAGEMLGKKLVTIQTGPEGRVVKRVLIEEGLEVERELYLGLVIDRTSGGPVFMASSEGGVEIEVVAAEHPERILKEFIDPALGLQPFQARKLAFGLELDAKLVNDAVRFFSSLYQAMIATDASLVEINPFVVTWDRRLLALDAKMNFDDSALYRHNDIRELRDLDEEDPLEVKASNYSLNYIRLDGNVGCMVNGAGLAMATMDIIQYAGGRPANFLDVGGGANEEQVRRGFEIILSDAHVRAVLINIFGGIMHCDIVANGVVAAVKSLGTKVPVVVRLEGTNVERGQQILRDSGLNFTVTHGMKDAAEKVVALARPRTSPIRISTEREGSFMSNDLLRIGWLDDPSAALPLVKGLARKAEAYKPRSIGEWSTASIFVEPLLRGLGWDTLDIEQVGRESRRPSQVADIHLYAGSPEGTWDLRLLLEVKDLTRREQDLESQALVETLRNNVRDRLFQGKNGYNARVRPTPVGGWLLRGVLTNGRLWMIHDFSVAADTSPEVLHVGRFELSGSLDQRQIDNFRDLLSREVILRRARG